MIQRLLIFLLLSTAQMAVAQNEGTLRLYLSPPAAAITIDGNPIEFGNSMQLKPGKYFVQAWCPHKALLDTIVEIKAGEDVNVFHRFKNSAKYNQYIAETRTFEAERNKHVTLPVAATVISAGALTFTILKGRSLEKEAQEKYDAYRYAGYDIPEKKAEFEEVQKKYRGYYYAQFVEYAALGVSAYFLYKGIQWVRNNPKPTLEKDNNPFSLDQVGVVPNQFGGYGLGVVINLN